ncbi:phosphoglucosamine mutase [Lyticum sinuosum]|uniref:Phosphoglucosamine mutase n=1 Tax=Lyticum sinuosum TaxID=1332059 RepID=A0AAE4VMH0_9RICK|nr:phosphoglucosamine mutase [Lyticum sinuosum]MDZ5761514.1 Phosphoglucosamine mutase [Lyticum sinuosum]
MFGTDGIRGRVNVYPLTAEMILRFGMAAGIYLRSEDNECKTNVIIAKDTRLSGYLLESSLIAGLVSVGIDVILVGPMPTPAISKLIRSLRVSFGIMITASHNPHHDNGFKLFNKYGEKLTENCEKEICQLIERNHFEEELAPPNKLGRVLRLDDAPGRYIEHVKRALPNKTNLQGFRIVVDCGNGAAYRIAPVVFWELGANVIPIHNEPDGLNINNLCGSIYPQSLQSKVIETRADIGIALDGDADRVCICDENGEIVDGDHIIGVIALELLHNQRMKKNESIIITDTSNDGLCDYAKDMGFSIIRTKVGDRNVAQAMKKNNSSLGAEKSGHIIISDYGIVSDGIVAALHILSYIIRVKKKTSSIHKIFPLYPQYNDNIYFYGDNPLMIQNVKNEIDEVISLNKDYRILVRKSGTERLIRLMVEGKIHHKTIEIGEEIKKILLKSIAVKS